MDSVNLGLLQKNYRILSKSRSGNQFLYILLGLFGLILIFIGGKYSLYRQSVLSFNSAPIPVQETRERKPKITKIELKQLGINLPVEEKAVVNGIWQIPEKGAAHLVSSANPGEGGNVVIYGHNKKSIFGPLLFAKKEMKIILTTADGKKIEYRITETLKVKPDEIYWVMPTKTELLTIYTCTGFLDSERLILRAIPTEIE